MKGLKFILIVCVSFWAQMVHAEQCKEIKPCDCIKPIEETQLRELADAAFDVSKALCESYGSKEVSDPYVLKQYKRFGNLVKRKTKEYFEHLKSPELKTLFEQVDLFAEETNDLNKGEILGFTFSPGVTLGSQASYGFDGLGQTRANINVQSSECTPEGKPSCKALLKDLGLVIEKHKEGYKARSAKDVGNEIHKMTKEWERYLEEARGQTSLDVWATTWLNKDVIKNDFLQVPMDAQYFVFHPLPAYEITPKSKDGDNESFGVSVELFGVNYWDGGPWFDFPYGASVTTLYSDKQGIEDFRIGFSLHINNKYSFGAVTMAGDHGFFMNVDIYGLFESKKSKWDSWRETLNKL
jgi:hypothetical protein